MLLLGLCLCGSAQSADMLDPANFKESLTFKGIYEFSLAGVRFGRLGIEFEQKDKDYNMTADIGSTGVINLFAKHTSHTTVDGTGESYNYPNRNYETHYQTKKKKRYVKMVYADGKETVEKIEPPENRDKRPAVEAKLKDAAVDPLTFVIAMRHSLYIARKEGKKKFTLTVYDGRRLTEANFTIAGTDVIEYNGRKLPVIDVAATRKQLAGFTPSEISDHSANEPVLHIYFSNDARQMPVELHADYWLGNISAKLVKECRTGESCLLGNKE